MHLEFSYDSEKLREHWFCDLLWSRKIWESMQKLLWKPCESAQKMFILKIKLKLKVVTQKIKLK